MRLKIITLKFNNAVHLYAIFKFTQFVVSFAIDFYVRILLPFDRNEILQLINNIKQCAMHIILSRAFIK